MFNNFFHPLKSTSGGAIPANRKIVIALLTLISVVFARTYNQPNFGALWALHQPASQSHKPTFLRAIQRSNMLSCA
jgi:hypothetical protein